jgi:CheY-like chemotaxis protein
LGLLTDILDLSRIEAGKTTLEKADYPLRQIMEDVMSAVGLRAEEKGLSLKVDYGAALPEVIHTDPLRLRQILVNLVGNAVKFTDRGEVRIAVRCLRTADRAAKIQFAVSDTGIGIAAERIVDLFQPFTQVDTSSTRLYGGTGLGLAISRRLAKALGGDIEVVSQYGKGSTFTLSIEAGLPEAIQGPPAVGEEPTPDPQQPGLQGRVLLAEDVPDVQHVVARILRVGNVQVETAENGRVACEMAEKSRAEGRPYDLILMDIRMPEMDGYAATQWLREHGWEGPIVALTAYAMAGDREKSLAAGCNDYVAKPLAARELRELLARYLPLQR